MELKRAPGNSPRSPLAFLGHITVLRVSGWLLVMRRYVVRSGAQTAPPPSSATQKLQRGLRDDVGLRQHRGACTDQDLIAGKGNRLLGNIGVPDGAFRR